MRMSRSFLLRLKDRMKYLLGLGTFHANGTRIIYEGYISGYQYHRGINLEHLFRSGTEFALRHEPENPFDEDAVAVYYDADRIGFLPPGENSEIAKMIKAGQRLIARIVRFQPESDPWERIYLEITD